MPVEDEFDLNLISDEQLDKLEAQADRLQAQADRIKKATQDLAGAPVDIDLGEEEPETGGIFGGETAGFIGFKEAQKITGGARQSAIRDKYSRAPAPFDPEMGFVKDMDQMQDAIDLLEAEVEKNREVIQQNTSRLTELSQAQREFFGKAQQAVGAFSNPMGFIRGNLFSALAKVAVPVGATLAIVTTVFELIKREFGPGGLFDVRKLVEDEVREYNSLEDIIKFDRGEIFLGFQSSIAQRTADIVNTENKVDGMMRDVFRNEGDYRRVQLGDL